MRRWVSPSAESVPVQPAEDGVLSAGYAGDKLFQTKELSRQLGTARLSFAPPERMEELLGCAPGSASVLGMAYDKSHQVHLLMDREVYESEWFWLPSLQK